MLCLRCRNEVAVKRPWQKYCSDTCARVDRMVRYWTKRLNLGGVHGASKDEGGGHKEH